MKKKLNFETLESLENVKRVLEEASEGLKIKTRNIDNSSIPDVLGAALGVGTGGVASFAALYLGGSVVGLSAAGITSGLAAAGAVVGGGMAAGVAVLAAPVAILGIAGYGVVSSYRHKKLQNLKEELLREVIKTHDAIVRALKEQIDSDKKRIEYLKSMQILLAKALQDLKSDMECA